jgi:DNA-binding NarL/FixJ family response regulator
MILSINLMLSILIFLQLFFTALLIAITAGKKTTAKLNAGNNEKPSEIQTPEQLILNSRKYALSTREVEILLLLREGLPYKLIGDKLHISQRTVSSHVANMFEKVNVTNKMELVNRMFMRTEFS